MPLLDWLEQETRHLKRIRRAARRRFNDHQRGSAAHALPLIYFRPEKRGANQPIHPADAMSSRSAGPPSSTTTVFNWISAADGVLIVLVILAAWYINRLPDEGRASGPPDVVPTTSAEQLLPESVFEVRSDIASDAELDAETWSSILPREAAPERTPTAVVHDAAVVLKQVKPTYPPAARQAGIEGTVVVTYSLAANGRPIDLTVTKSIPALDEAALAALRQWEYTKPPPGSTQKYRFNAEFVLDGN